MSKTEDARRNGKVLAFGSAVLNSLPREISPEEMEYWVGHQGELAERFRADQTFALKRTVKFPVAGYFTLSNTAVKFNWIGDDFKSWFYGKTEKVKGVVSVPRPHHDLCKASLDCEILNDLGGEAKAVTTLAGIYELLKFQPNGQSGMLLNDGGQNIFYVRDDDSVLRAMSVCRLEDGWLVQTYSVEYPSRWFAGSRIFSC